MIIKDELLSEKEKAMLSLRELYSGSGYKSFRMSKFEEYDFYAQNKDFLVSDNVITFTDTTGKLMALKPDVTLSIVKSCRDMPDTVTRLFYSENVYRVSGGTGAFKEIMQTGLECIGNVGSGELAEVIILAAKSLKVFSDKAVLVLSDLSVIKSALAEGGAKKANEKRLLKAAEEKNLRLIEEILGGGSALEELLRISGSIDDVIPKLKNLAKRCGKRAVGRFLDTLRALKSSDEAGNIRIDFSVMDDINYYNGIVFKGFAPELPEAVLSGGQYDSLMKKLGKNSKAIGFAAYTDLLDRIADEKSKKNSSEEYINIALPKGRLGEKVYSMFEKAGLDCAEIKEEGRKLIFENREKRLRFFWVKPSDAAIYVERGAADIGVAGKDILEEYSPDVYELADLKTGKCRMAVAGPKGFKDDIRGALRVATKFRNVAMEFYGKKGRDIDIIELNGSIELAPILGLSDVIVDIVETGTTLKENNLEVVEEVFGISARLIANKSAYSFKTERIEEIARSLAALAEEKK